MAWSKFFTRLVEAVDKHVGRYSNARLIVSDATAEAEARRLLAQADRDAEDIRAGRMSLVAAASPDRPDAISPQDKSTEELTYEQRVIARMLHQEIQRDQNIQRVVAHAMLEENEDAVDEDTKPDDDLIARIFNETQFVSNEELQELWGRLLAGAIKHPAAYTVDVVDFLRRLNSDRARDIARMGPYQFVTAIVNNVDRIAEVFPDGNKYWIRMQHYGLIDGVFADWGVSIPSTEKERYFRSQEYGGKVLVWEHEDKKDEQIRFSAYMITELGRQVLQLGKFEPDYEYLWQIGKKIKAKYPDFTVRIGDVVAREGDMLNVRNFVPIERK